MLTGKTVGLRPIEPSDLPVLTRLANDPTVRQLVVGWDWPVAAFRQQSWLEDSTRQSSTCRLAVVDLARDAPIGLTGLWDIDWHNRSALSAIKLDAELSPRGAGTDTVMLVNAWAFYEVGLRRLWGAILPFNAASLNLYVRKCGWSIEGVERQAIFRDGEFHDLIKVALLESDFRNHPQQPEYRRHVSPLGDASGDTASAMLPPVLDALRSATESLSKGA